MWMKLTVSATAWKEGGVRGARKLQNRTEIRQKNSKPHLILTKYRNRTYMDMEAHYMKTDV